VASFAATTCTIVLLSCWLVPLGLMFDSVVVVNISNCEGREIILGVAVGSTVDSRSVDTRFGLGRSVSAHARTIVRNSAEIIINLALTGIGFIRLSF